MADNFGSTAKATQAPTHQQNEDQMGLKSIPKEGELTKKVENVTANIPSMGFLGLAVGSMAVSALIAAFSKRKDMANFVGLWVPTIMLVGIYNKLVKLEGSDRFSRGSVH